MNMWLVGAGYWGSKLLTSLKKFDVDAQVIDIRNGQTIDDINTLDPVMLATPLWQHHQQTCELLRRGHDVYVEKPMAETLDQVLDIERSLSPDQLLMVPVVISVHWCMYPAVDSIGAYIKPEQILCLVWAHTISVLLQKSQKVILWSIKHKHGTTATMYNPIVCIFQVPAIASLLTLTSVGIGLFVQEKLY